MISFPTEYYHGEIPKDLISSFPGGSIERYAAHLTIVLNSLKSNKFQEYKIVWVIFHTLNSAILIEG